MGQMMTFVSLLFGLLITGLCVKESHGTINIGNLLGRSHHDDDCSFSGHSHHTGSITGGHDLGIDGDHTKYLSKLDGDHGLRFHGYLGLFYQIFNCFLSGGGEHCDWSDIARKFFPGDEMSVKKFNYIVHSNEYRKPCEKFVRYIHDKSDGDANDQAFKHCMKKCGLYGNFGNDIYECYDGYSSGEEDQDSGESYEDMCKRVKKLSMEEFSDEEVQEKLCKYFARWGIKLTTKQRKYLFTGEGKYPFYYFLKASHRSSTNVKYGFAFKECMNKYADSDDDDYDWFDCLEGRCGDSDEDEEEEPDDGDDDDDDDSEDPDEDSEGDSGGKCRGGRRPCRRGRRRGRRSGRSRRRGRRSGRSWRRTREYAGFKREVEAYQRKYCPVRRNGGPLAPLAKYTTFYWDRFINLFTIPLFGYKLHSAFYYVRDRTRNCSDVEAYYFCCRKHARSHRFYHDFVTCFNRRTHYH